MYKEHHILLKNIRDGDIHSFEKIYAEFYESLCRYLLNYTTDRKEIEDAVQDSFLYLWEKRRKIEIKTSLKNYLYRTAYNRLADKFRKGKRQESMLDFYYHTAVMEVTETDPEYKSQRIKKLEECISGLPERCRRIFVACKISGLKYGQVAQEFNLSLKTVEGHITNGFKLIRACMNDGE
ncbi:RNA polymerase sigma factor [Sinomicrobium soli]|uniref:RNA polymerase sigma factor n=1 Tax=Sinomicrobium sp. N-1-3-6 TaxID=2219864 RepID=UPI000DCCAAF7|nr:RNA polymerase sigma-70 factor [Sinomicrobium sp. N-1-3-6]RAV29384.1 RNA polymerase sigma-70 factor [Sinomicrobium sp. N-1-3-6]